MKQVFFTFAADADWLALDAIPLSAFPSPLRSVLGSTATFVVMGQAGMQTTVSIRPDDGIATGKGLGRLLRKISTRLVAATWDGQALRVAPFPLAGTAVAHANGQPSRLHDASLDPVQKLGNLFDQLASGALASERALLGHLRARTLVSRPGFDELLALQVLPFTPFEYQVKTAIRVLRDMRGSALLCDEVGLGKTIEAGMILLEYVLRGLARRVLILTPATLVEQWREELRWKFNLGFTVQDDPEFVAAGDNWPQLPRLLLSLQFARRREHAQKLMTRDFDLVIVDEAHHLRNRESKSWQLVSQLKKRFLLLLTATPVQNDLEELFNLVTLLRPGQLGTALEFKARFTVANDPLSPRNASALRALTRTVMIRNRRSETGLALPPRRAEVIQVALSPPELAFYESVTQLVREAHARGRLSTFVLKILQQEAGSSVAAAASTLKKLGLTAAQKGDKEWGQRLMTLAELGEQHNQPGSKTVALADLLQRSPADHAILFTGFRQTQAGIAQLLQTAGHRVFTFHGEMSRAEKEEAVRRFESDGGVLVTTESGGEGRNLQFCNVLINYDLPWNPMRIEQRIGRVHRIGQTKPVSIYNLAARQTIEEHLLKLLTEKINLFELVVGELDMILGPVTDDKEFDDLILDLWASAADEQSFLVKLQALSERLAESRARYQETKAREALIYGALEEEA